MEAANRIARLPCQTVIIWCRNFHLFCDEVTGRFIGQQDIAPMTWGMANGDTSYG
jgi:hypothetical protein